ncbi:MAG: hypothetical protein BA863_05135 [Desulfovibrio sp. S3730MH75]|nr:MAG: hypothetical protein BA863_05135 [Desulfovibrio sp. S3730MH75]
MKIIKSENYAKKLKARIDDLTTYFEEKGLRKSKALELALNLCGLQCQIDPCELRSVPLEIKSDDEDLQMAVKDYVKGVSTDYSPKS